MSRNRKSLTGKIKSQFKIIGRCAKNSEGTYTYKQTPATLEYLRSVDPHLKPTPVMKPLDKMLKERDESYLFAQGKLSLPVPDGIDFSGLWDHQKAAITWATHIYAGLLWAPMGSGKTRIGAKLCNPFKTLIVCPKYVIPIWVRELYYQGFNEIYVKKESLQGITVANYESIWRGTFGKWVVCQDWEVIILDECQKIKGHGSKVSKFCAKLKAKRKIAMSGTPISNGPLDFFGIARFLDTGIFGMNYGYFEDQYAQHVNNSKVKYKFVVGYKNLPDLKARINPYIYKIPEGLLDLPELQKIVVPVRLPKYAQKLYNTFNRDFVVALGDSKVRASNILVKLLKLQLFTSGIAKDVNGKEQVVNSEKANALKEFLEESRNEKVVVVGRFRHDLDVACATCAMIGRKYVELPNEDNEILDVAGMQVRSGTGIDLTEASTMIFLSTGYSSTEVDQAIARILRPPQDKPVRVYFIIAENTIDEKIYHCLKNKKNLIHYLKYGV